MEQENSQRWLKIQNTGNLTMEDLLYTGDSPKRDDPGTIGEFGSGSSHVLAYLLGNKVPFVVCNGAHVFKIETATVGADRPREVFVIDDNKSTTCVTWSHQWDQWMILREIVANAIDEGGYDIDIVDDIEPIEGVDDVQVVQWYLDLGHFQEVSNNLDSLFSNARRDVVYKDNDIVLYTDKFKSTCIYFKGMYAYEREHLRTFPWDLNFLDGKINEERILSWYTIKYKWNQFFWTKANRQIILEFMSKCNRDTTLISGSEVESYPSLKLKVSEAWKDLCKDYYFAPLSAEKYVHGDKIIFLHSDFIKSMKAMDLDVRHPEQISGDVIVSGELSSEVLQEHKQCLQDIAELGDILNVEVHIRASKISIGPAVELGSIMLMNHELHHLHISTDKPVGLESIRTGIFMLAFGCGSSEGQSMAKEFANTIRKLNS
jgi:hypothetical protein